MRRAQPLLSFEGIPDGFIQELNARFRAVAGGTVVEKVTSRLVGSGTAPPPAFVTGTILRVLLVHLVTTTVAAPTATADGDQLVVFLQQPSNAQGRVAWDANFSADTPTEIDSATDNSLARVKFVWGAAEAKWIFLEMNPGGIVAPVVASLTVSIPTVFPTSTTQRVTLVHNVVTTVTAPVASAEGDLLTVLLKQPSNAQGQVAWDAGFSLDTPTAIDTATNDSVARVRFVWSVPDLLWIFLDMNAGGLL